MSALETRLREAAGDPMHAIERVRTLCDIKELEAIISRLSAGAYTAKCGRGEWDKTINDLSFYPEMLRDLVEGR